MQQQKPGALAGVSSLLDGSDMVRVPPGEFSMGSNDGNPDEVPTRRIRITKPFEIGKYEVTQAQWEAVVGSSWYFSWSHRHVRQCCVGINPHEYACGLA